MHALRDALVANGWFADSFKFGRLTAHRQGLDIPLPQEVAKIVRFYPAYSFQIRSHWGRFYLCIDYTLEVKNLKTVQSLLTYFEQNDIVVKSAVAQWKGWQHGKIISADREWTHIRFFDFEQEEQIASNKVIPNLPTSMIEQLLNHQSIKFDIYQAIKEHSLALELNAPRIRFEKTQAIIYHIAETIFPLAFSEIHAFLQTNPTSLSRQEAEKEQLLVNTLSEPSVVFNHHQETIDIRSGITTFGAYDHIPKTIELIPICTNPLRQNMVNLIERLKTGKYKYRGSERTFGTRFNIILS